MDVDISNLFHREENEQLEYKEGFNRDDFAETVAAFSTCKGGTILIGVKDNGEPVGFKKAEKLDEKIQDIGKNIGAATIAIETIKHTQDLSIVAVGVSEGSKKPYGWKGIFYDRKGKNDYKLGSDEIFKIKLKALNLTFDALGAECYNRAANINDLDETKIKNFVEKLKTNKRKKIHEFKNVKKTLVNLDLLLDNGHQPKNAAVFLFAKKLQQSFPSAKINFLVYKEDEINEDYKFRDYIEGTLLEQLGRAFSLFKQYTENKIVIQGLKRMEITQYPLIAIRESLINAIAHRDYTITDSEIMIRVFRNHIEITNPGGLLKGVNLEELRKGGHPSKRRNPLICQLFDNLGLMEQSGQGIKNMITAMKERGLNEPLINADEYSFKIVFEGQVLNGKVPESLNVKIADLEKELNKRQRKTLKYIQTKLDEKEGITATKYSTKFKVHIITAKKDLEKFREIGLLKPEKRGQARPYFKVD